MVACTLPRSGSVRVRNRTFAVAGWRSCLWVPVRDRLDAQATTMSNDPAPVLGAIAATTSTTAAALPDPNNVVLAMLAQRYLDGSTVVDWRPVEKALLDAGHPVLQERRLIRQTLNALTLVGAVEPIHKPPRPHDPHQRVFFADANEPDQWLIQPHVVALAQSRCKEAPPAEEPETPTSATASPNGTQQSEGEKPPAGPFIPLTSWSEILAALNEPHGNPVWKNTEQTRDKIRKLNEQHNGPIRLPQGSGTQPSVAKAALMEWWNGLSEHFDSRNDEGKAETESARLTVADSHNYGAAGKVVPGIGGSEKRTRANQGEKGVEGKR